MSLSQFICSGDLEKDIHTLGQTIEAHITENWQLILETRREKLLDAYNRAGDMAYGAYLDLLFRPVHKQLKQAGLRASPRLPGDFDISREWGVADETDQQRWMWSTIEPITASATESTQGAPLGTIVVIVFHDHTQFRVPRQPQIIALTESGKEAVVEALAQRSTDFRQAREASIEIAAYLQSLQDSDKQGD